MVWDIYLLYMRYIENKVTRILYGMVQNEIQFGSSMKRSSYMIYDSFAKLKNTDKFKE